MFLGFVKHLEPGPTRLRYLYVSLSNICNARCMYCDVHSAPAPVRPFARPELSAIFGEAASMGCRTVHFMGGGEPLVAPSLADAMAACAEHNLGAVVTTNGSHLARCAETVLRDVRLEAVLVSLDSHEATVHNAVRRFNRLWERAGEGIRAVRALGAPVILNHVLTADNVERVEEYLLWAASAGVSAVNFIPVKDTPALAVSSGQADGLAGRLQTLRSAAAALGITLMCRTDDVVDWAGSLAGRPSGREYRCVFPEHTLYIDFPTGSVFPCDCTVHRKPQERFDLGNVWERPLSEIWAGGPIRRLREELASPCDPGCKRDCDWNNVQTNACLIAGNA
jgi:MoaA/NifB/PqqE/SkfB family radical SAM enzyme